MKSSEHTLDWQVQGAVLYRFAVIADSHLNPADKSNTSPWQTNHMANPRNEVVVEAINRIGVDFTVHVGDVVHPLPHTPDFEPAARYALSLYGKLKRPFYIAPGNHDIGDKCLPGNPAATISAATCAAYEAQFGAQWQSFEQQGCRFVLINACLLGSGREAERAQWDWLEQTLQAAQGQRVFLFTHYPPFITAADEEDNYDNIDRVPRQRLLDLIEANGIEACFAGHVHTFFLNRIGNTISYALPSSTNFRQDYAELFRAEALEELGRNDTGKFGFFLVDVHEKGHVARFVRTDGSTALAEVPHIIERIGVDVRSSRTRTPAVSLCHDWTGSSSLPFNPPLDTFIRKVVRSDYTALNLWDCGIRNVRIPIQDIRDDAAHERVRLLAGLGHGFVVFSRHPLDATDAQRLLRLGDAVVALEFVCEARAQAAQALLCSVPPALALRTYFAPYYTPSAQHAGAAPYDHNMKCGFEATDAQALLDFCAELDKAALQAGVVVRIEAHQDVHTTMELIQRTVPAGVPLMVEVCLMPRQSSVFADDMQQTAARVSAAAELAARQPQVIVAIDTFMDIDRGYFPRRGLVDRHQNPNAAGWAAREAFNRMAAEA